MARNGGSTPTLSQSTAWVLRHATDGPQNRRKHVGAKVGTVRVPLGCDIGVNEPFDSTLTKSTP